MMIDYEGLLNPTTVQTNPLHHCSIFREDVLKAVVVGHSGVILVGNTRHIV